MLAPLARFIDWLSIQMWFTRMPHADERSQRLEEALQFLKGPDFIPAESQPAQVEFRGPVHFRFPTPQPCEFAENNVVPGRLYRCAGHWQERPMIVLLHGLNDSTGYRFRYPLIARRCNRAGFSAAMLVAPYRFQRRPRQVGSLHDPDYLRWAKATAQAIAEIRALTGWLLGEGCPAVALWGFSYGGWLAGLTACHDARLASAVLTKPGVRSNLSLPELVFRRSIREAMQRHRAALEAVNRTSLNLSSGPASHPQGEYTSDRRDL